MFLFLAERLLQTLPFLTTLALKTQLRFKNVAENIQKIRKTVVVWPVLAAPP
jgi:hypothetical protein